MSVKLSPKLQQFTTIGANEEAILQPLYHYKNLAAAAISPLTFFGVQQGGSDPDTGAVASAEDTNMKQAGALPRTNRYLVQKIRVPIIPVTTLVTPVSGATPVSATEDLSDDIARLTFRGRLIFTIMTKPYLEISPLGECAAGYGLGGAIAVGTFQTSNLQKMALSNGGPSCEGGRKVMLPLTDNSTFNVMIDFPKATLTLAVAVVGFGLIGFVATGILFEAAVIVLTIGEMVIVPASQTIAADLAPADMRGRYQAVYGLVGSLGFGIGPVIAGSLFDAGLGRWIWIGSLILGLIVAAGFRSFGPRLRAREALIEA